MIGLQYLCDINNLTGIDLAKKLNVSKQTISNWMSGRRNIPKKHYEKIREIFKAPEEYFQKELDELDKYNLLILKGNNMNIKNYQKEIVFEREIIKYLNKLKEDRLNILECEDFTKFQSIKYGYECEVKALEIVIQLVKDNIKN